jgi:prepilin-type N-terminal cleavage/methylation domain-containing protein
MSIRTSCPGPRDRRFRGFTLVELVIAVLIIAILSTFSILTYRWMLDKARMTQAKTVLQHLVKAESIFYGENDRYTDDLTRIDFNPVKYEYYQVSVVLDNNMKNFTGTASGVGPMAGDRWFVTKDKDPYQDNTSPFFRQ